MFKPFLIVTFTGLSLAAILLGLYLRPLVLEGYVVAYQRGTGPELWLVDGSLSLDAIADDSVGVHREAMYVRGDLDTEHGFPDAQGPYITSGSLVGVREDAPDERFAMFEVQRWMPLATYEALCMVFSVLLAAAGAVGIIILSKALRDSKTPRPPIPY